MNILVPLAEGFEEIEAIAVIDILRRARLNVATAALKSCQVTGSHNITITAEHTLDEIDHTKFNVVFLPGGPGTKNLKSDTRIIKIIQDIYNQGGYAAAICAAPTVLAEAGLLKGKTVTCFPGFENDLKGGIFSAKPFIQDERIITGQAAGTAISFALFMVKILKNENETLLLRKKLQVYWDEI